MVSIKKTKTAEKAAPEPEKAEKAAAPKAPKTAKTVKTAKASKAPKAPKEPKAAPKRRVAASKVSVIFEHQGRQVAQDKVLEAIVQEHAGAVKSLELYFKAEDGAVYYVLNGDITGKVEI